MLPKDKLKILYRRWGISLVVVLIVITWLHLWTVVAWLFMAYLLLVGIFKLLAWLTGADLYGYSNDHQPSDEEKTMWDIFTTSQLFKHHDDNLK